MAKAISAGDLKLKPVYKFYIKIGQAIAGLWANIIFSVVTFTTLGYGNFVPANTAAEVIAAFEAITGFAVFALLIGIASAVALQKENK